MGHKQVQQYKKLCECGCGQTINAYYNGWASMYRRFKNGHNGRLLVRERHHHWGGGVKHTNGYVLVLVPENRHASSEGYCSKHILIYELYHKCSILPGIQVHHINGIRDDNRLENLTLLPVGIHLDYHRHKRTEPRFT